MLSEINMVFHAFQTECLITSVLNFTFMIDEKLNKLQIHYSRSQLFL